MLEIFWQSFYLILPAYFANMAPVIFARAGWLKSLARPIDAGRKMGGQDLFGKSKTWRGLISAVIMSLAIVDIQTILFSTQIMRDFSVIDYSKYWWSFGILSGLGAILGDLFKSFLKRRVGIGSGKSWPVFDQLDFIAGFFLFTFWLVHPAWNIVIMTFVMTLILHPLVNLFAYLLGIKKVPW